MKQLSIIIVNWNTAKLIGRCLKSIEKYYSSYLPEWEICVIDNNSNDDSVKTVQQFPFVKLIANTENKGFAHANNQGVAISTGDYILFLNSDTEFIDQSLVQLFDVFKNERVGVVGCHLLYTNMQHQPSIRRHIRFIDQCIIFLKLHNFFPRLIARYMCMNFDYTKEQKVDAVMGAFMFCRRTIVELLGGLDERFWIWMEDSDFCLNVKRLGYQIVYYPFTRVIHVKGESFAQHLTLTKQKMFVKSVLAYFYKNHSIIAYYGLFPFAGASFILAYLYDRIRRIGSGFSKNKDL